MNYAKNLMAGIAAAVLLAPTTAHADDIYKGMRGPTNYQADSRIVWSRTASTETITPTIILKYWDGDASGKWGFVTVPYRFFFDSPTGDHHGTGDATAGFGPRGRTGPVNFLTYGAVTLPTGTPAKGGGNERYDAKAGCFLTATNNDKQFEADGSAEFTITGKNKKGTNPPNELNIGFVAGGKLNEQMRFAAGMTHSRTLFESTEDNHMTAARLVGRYTFSKKLHVELMGDVTIDAQRMQKRKTITGIVRYNF